MICTVSPVSPNFKMLCPIVGLMDSSHPAARMQGGRNCSMPFIPTFRIMHQLWTNGKPPTLISQHINDRSQFSPAISCENQPRIGPQIFVWPRCSVTCRHIFGFCHDFVEMFFFFSSNGHPSPHHPCLKSMSQHWRGAQSELLRFWPARWTNPAVELGIPNNSPTGHKPHRFPCNRNELWLWIIN